MFPQYVPKTTRPLDRKLFFLENYRLYDEKGELFRMVATYEEFIGCIFRHNCLIVVNDFLVSFPFIDECVHDKLSEVVCNKNGVVSSIRIRRSNITTWIITPKTWDYNDEDPYAFLLELRHVFDHFNIGVFPTPSSLGYNLMLLSWKENGLLRHSVANGFASEFISKHRVGGRADTPGLGEEYDVASMYDLSSAYCAFFASQPCGTTIGFRRTPHDLKNWFARCTIRIKRELPLGPFPVREHTSRGRLYYPTSVGTYESYLWSSQVDDVIASGCNVSIEGGFGWRETTNDTIFWCRDIFLKRIAAEVAGDRSLVKYVKQCTVAAIGRHGAGNVFYNLVPEEEATDEDVHVSYDGKSYAYFVRRRESRDNANMIHWNTVAIMETSRALYNFALPYAERDELIATNYDAVFTKDKENVHGLHVKYTADQIVCAPGTWLWCLIHNLEVLGPRTFRSREMTVMPGIKKTA